LPDAVQPRLVRTEAVLGLHRGGWKIVKCPHAFIGTRGRNGKRSKGSCRNQLVEHWGFPEKAAAGYPRVKPGASTGIQPNLSGIER
jgi:hypothetical protein